MSKYFDETQKAQWATRPATPGNLDVQKLMDTIKQGESVASDMIESRLRNCRKMSIAGSSKSLAVMLPSREGSSSAAEAYRTLRTRLMRLQRESGIRSVMITSAIPGEGKTLTALNLALCCAQLHNNRVLLMDGDLRSRGLTRLLGYPGGPGLSEALSGNDAFDRTILATEHKNLFVVAAGSASSSPAEQFAGSSWAEFIGWCGESFNIILVDSPPIHSLADAELISAGCDGVLMVVRALATPRELAAKCARRIDAKKFFGVIFNAHARGTEGSYAYYGSSNGKPKET